MHDLDITYGYGLSPVENHIQILVQQQAMRYQYERYHKLMTDRFQQGKPCVCEYCRSTLVKCTRNECLNCGAPI